MPYNNFSHISLSEKLLSMSHESECNREHTLVRITCLKHAELHCITIVLPCLTCSYEFHDC